DDRVGRAQRGIRVAARREHRVHVERAQRVGRAVRRGPLRHGSLGHRGRVDRSGFDIHARAERTTVDRAVDCGVAAVGDADTDRVRTERVRRAELEAYDLRQAVGFVADPITFGLVLLLVLRALRRAQPGDVLVLDALGVALDDRVERVAVAD